MSTPANDSATTPVAASPSNCPAATWTSRDFHVVRLAPIVEDTRNDVGGNELEGRTAPPAASEQPDAHAGPAAAPLSSAGAEGLAEFSGLDGALHASSTEALERVAHPVIFTLVCALLCVAVRGYIWHEVDLRSQPHAAMNEHQPPPPANEGSSTPATAASGHQA